MRGSSCIDCGSGLVGTENFCPYCGSRMLMDDPQNVIVVNSALPVPGDYEEVVKVNLENPNSIRIPRANLSFCPYYLFYYVLDINRKDPTGKNHRIHLRGIHILNAFNGNLLTDKGNKGSKRIMNVFIPKRISNKNRHHDDMEEYNETETNEIITDLKTIAPVDNYKVKSTDDYSINIIEDKISLKPAERLVSQKIIEDNTTKVFYKMRKSKDRMEEKEMNILPRYADISIEKKILVYLPKWIIIIKAGASAYKRKVLAASNKILIDEIAVCPRHFPVPKIWDRGKLSSAVCEICGGAFCSDHIVKVGHSFFCEEHRTKNPIK